ncbi:hypothetical protein DXG01_003729 [Tephrocybe rancida]|nr:hypothetical protein DXG01_003729 [Tephrocybe rancida]
MQMIALEAVLWRQLSHPNLLPFYGLCIYNNRLALVSPWISNGTLSDFLEKEPMANRRLLCSDVADGIGYLHDNNIIHGDLSGVRIPTLIGYEKVNNSRQTAYLSDFRMSAVKDMEVMTWSRRLEYTVPRVRWQAPELFKLKNIGHDSDSEIPRNTKATDIYAFSCIFTGSVPFPLVSNDKIMLKVLAGERPIFPSGSESHLLGPSGDFRTLIQACWRTDATDRPSISEIRLQLASLLPRDHRQRGEWQGKSPAREGDADVPLTPRMLDKILRRTLC